MMAQLRTYLKILNIVKKHRNGIIARQIAEHAGASIRTTYRHLALITENEPLYTDRRGKNVYYLMLRGDE